MFSWVPSKAYGDKNPKQETSKIQYTESDSCCTPPLQLLQKPDLLSYIAYGERQCKTQALLRVYMLSDSGHC